MEYIKNSYVLYEDMCVISSFFLKLYIYFLFLFLKKFCNQFIKKKNYTPACSSSARNVLHLFLSTLTASVNKTAGDSVPTDSILTKN